MLSGLRYIARPLVLPFGHCKPLVSESPPVLSFLSTFFFLLVTLAELNPHLKKDFPFASCYFPHFALRHFVNDHELCDVRSSPRLYLFLDTGAPLLSTHLCLEIENEINSTPDEIQPFLLLISVKPSVTQRTHICLDCRCVWSFTQDRVIVSDDPCDTICWNVSEVNNSITECLIKLFNTYLVLRPNPFHKLCRYATCCEREARAVSANFSDQVPLYFLADAKLRSNVGCPPVPPVLRPCNRIVSKCCGELE